jgi:2-polyprenyl-6-methoxyphenol hydroxylase-like FAD-dependent oxidoreductase
MKVLIIGGGLGGLCLARGLNHFLRDNVDVVVYERDCDQQTRKQGYIIGLNSDGLSSLTKCGLSKEDFDMFWWPENAGGFMITDEQLNQLLAFGGSISKPKQKENLDPSQVQSTLVCRWQLRKSLLRGVNICWGKKAVSVSVSADGKGVVHFDDQTTDVGDIIVGADGIRSIIRNSIDGCPFRPHPLSLFGIAGSLTMSKVPIKLREKIQIGLIRLLGLKSVSWLFLRFREANLEERLIWVCNFDPQVENVNMQGHEDDVPYLFNLVKQFVIDPQYDQSIAQMVDFTSHLDFIENRQLHAMSADEILNSPFAKGLRSGPVTLLGDAAHTMTTHAGLGANTAFQDANDLLNAIKKVDAGLIPIEKALREYESVIAKRGAANVKTSFRNTESLITKSPFDHWKRKWILWVIGRIVAFFLFVKNWFSILLIPLFALIIFFFFFL